MVGGKVQLQQRGQYVHLVLWEAHQLVVAEVQVDEVVHPVEVLGQLRDGVEREIQVNHFVALRL